MSLILRNHSLKADGPPIGYQPSLDMFSKWQLRHNTYMEIGKSSWALDSELAHCHFFFILLTKASQEGS